MKPRKLTKTIKAELERKKQAANIKRQMTRENRKSVATTLMKTSVCAELFSNKHIPSANTGKHDTSRRSMMEDRFKESPEVREAIERKANCLAPAFSKGAYTYIGDAESAKCAGRKNV